MSLFIAPERRQLLELNSLDSFNAVWHRRADWFEEPNDYRGGWSGVSRLALAMADGSELGAFLKRQQNHTRRSLLHPFRGEATFTREFQIIRHLQKYGVPTPQPIFFAEHRTKGDVQAILLTEELVNYRPFEEIIEVISSRKLSVDKQRTLLRAIAKAVRKMHLAKIQHRSLYPKHLFVKENGDDYDVVLIDFEKSRFSTFPFLRVISDLVTLNYRTNHLTRSSRLYFFKQYYGIDRLGPWQKIMCRFIHKRSLQKSMKQKVLG